MEIKIASRNTFALLLLGIEVGVTTPFCGARYALTVHVPEVVNQEIAIYEPLRTAIDSELQDENVG